MKGTDRNSVEGVAPKSEDWPRKRAFARKEPIQERQIPKGFGDGHRCAEAFAPQSDSRRVAMRREGTLCEEARVVRWNDGGAAGDQRRPFQECAGMIGES